MPHLIRRSTGALVLSIGASLLWGGHVHAQPGYGFDFCPIFGQMFRQGPSYGYGPAYGQQYRPRIGWSMTQAVMARTVDENGDGVISDDEAAARYEELFATIDADGDGMLTNHEYMAVRRGAAAEEVFYGPRNQQMHERKRNRFQTMDANGDGKVSQSEFMVGCRERFQASDLDKDGKVTAWEFRSRPRL
jgi:hypothetical protein